MKTLKLTIIPILLLSILGSRAFSQQYVWQSLSTNDAIQSVRNFEANPSLAVNVDQSPNAQAAPAPWISYILTAANYRYILCAYSHDMFIRTDMTFLLDKATFYGQAYNPNVLASQTMPQSNAQSIAQAFMQAHFPHPEVLTKISVWPDWDSDPTNGNPVFIKD